MTEWRKCDERKLAGWLLAFMVSVLVALVLFPAPLYAGGLQASFGASRFDCPDDPSVVACYKGVVDGSGNLIDHSENLLTYRTEFDDWTESGTCAVTADQWRNPVDGSVDADYLDNTGGVSTNFRGLTTINLGALGGRTFTFSVWVRADYNHTATIRLVETSGYTGINESIYVTNTWHRFYINWTVTAGAGAASMRAVVFPGENGVSTGTAYFYGAQIIENDEWRTGMGYFVNPSDQSITKPALDLAPNNDPTAARAHVQMSGGNKGPARSGDGNDYYSKAHPSSMDIFDEDHTVTFFVYQVDGDGSSDCIQGFHAWHTSGVGLYSDGANTDYRAYYHNNGGHVTVENDTDPDDGMYHIGQLVRSDNNATLYVDGVAGTSMDVTGYGIDGVNAYVLMANSTGGEGLNGQIAYTVIRSRALSTDERAAEREQILGTYTNWSR